jgi:hypothetical protein
MPFSIDERVKLATKVLAAGVIDGFEDAQWYESRFPNSTKSLASDVYDTNLLTGFGYVVANPASNLAAARIAAAGNPLVLRDWTVGDQPYAGTAVPGGVGVGTAVRLSPVPGTNDAFGFSTYAAYTTYNSFSSPRMVNWLKPQQVPQPSGAPSIGYAISLYDGDPNAGGVLISTAAGQGGTPPEVGWIFNADSGLLFLAQDFRATITDPYIVGFQYIGPTLANPAPLPAAFYLSLNDTWLLDVGSPEAIPEIRNNIETIRFLDGADAAIYLDFMVPVGYDPLLATSFVLSLWPVANLAGDIRMAYQVQSNGGGFPLLWAPTTTTVSGATAVPQTVTFPIPVGAFTTNSVVTIRVARLGDPVGLDGTDTYAGGGIDFLSAYIAQ